jgi:hypothetical protein
VPPHKNLSHSASVDFALSANFKFDQILAVDYRHIAKMLNFGAGKFQPDQLAAICLKLGRGLQNLRLMLPTLFTGADYNCALRHEFLQKFGVVGKPGSPDGFAHFGELGLIARACKRNGQGCQRNPNQTAHLFHFTLSFS